MCGEVGWTKWRNAPATRNGRAVCSGETVAEIGNGWLQKQREYVKEGAKRRYERGVQICAHGDFLGGKCPGAKIDVFNKK